MWFAKCVIYCIELMLSNISKNRGEKKIALKHEILYIYGKFSEWLFLWVFKEYIYVYRVQS